MTSTEAQKRASAKYNRDKTKVMQLRFYPSDMELLEHVRKQGNMQGYVKSLIRADMERGGQPGNQEAISGRHAVG